MNKMILFTILAMIFMGCEIIQTITPSDIDIVVEAPAPPPPVEFPTDNTNLGTIRLDPSSATVGVGSNVNVMVVVTDSNGTEVPSENLSVNIADLDILRLQQIDGRIIQFEGVSPGETSVIVSASGLQTSIVITVIP